MSLLHDTILLVEDDSTPGLARAMRNGMAWGAAVGVAIGGLAAWAVWGEGAVPASLLGAGTFLGTILTGACMAGRSRQQDWQLQVRLLGGLSSGGVRRVYRALVRLVYCDGRVDDAELEVLEELRDIWGITPRAADRLEREGRDQTRFKLGRDTVEQGVLLHATKLLIERKGGVLSPRESSYLDRMLKPLGVLDTEAWLAA